LRIRQINFAKQTLQPSSRQRPFFRCDNTPAEESVVVVRSTGVTSFSNIDVEIDHVVVDIQLTGGQA
jgi:hypothetical protein